MRKKIILFCLFLIMVAICSMRIMYVKLRWGGYWAIDFVAPWRSTPWTGKVRIEMQDGTIRETDFKSAKKMSTEAGN